MSEIVVTEGWFVCQDCKEEGILKEFRWESELLRHILRSHSEEKKWEEQRKKLLEEKVKLEEELERLREENKKKEEENKKKEEKNKEENKKLEDEICVLRSLVERLARMLHGKEDEEEFYKRLRDTVVEMIKKFPKNSPLRRSLIANLSKGIDKKKFVELVLTPCGMSSSYFSKIGDEDDDILFQVKSSLYPQKRERWTKEEKAAFADILDDIMPFASGRDWRIRQWTKEDTHKEYEEIMKKRYPLLRRMCYTSFWDHFKMRKEKVHFLKVVKHCPICNAMEKRNELGEGELTEEEKNLITDNPDHEKEIRDAYAYYKQMKNKISQEKLTDTAVIVQDPHL